MTTPAAAAMRPGRRTRRNQLGAVGADRRADRQLARARRGGGRDDAVEADRREISSASPASASSMQLSAR